MFAVLVAVLIIVSLLLRLIPGDPVDAMMSGNPGMTQENMDAVREQLGLTDPMYVQVLNYSTDLLQGDMGDSLRFRYARLSADHGKAAGNDRAHGVRHDHGDSDRGSAGDDYRVEARSAGGLRGFDRGGDRYFDSIVSARHLAHHAASRSSGGSFPRRAMAGRWPVRFASW